MGCSLPIPKPHELPSTPQSNPHGPGPERPPPRFAHLYSTQLPRTVPAELPLGKPTSPPAFRTRGRPPGWVARLFPARLCHRIGKPPLPDGPHAPEARRRGSLLE